jgi:hypothetical protein
LTLLVKVLALVLDNLRIFPGIRGNGVDVVAIHNNRTSVQELFKVHLLAYLGSHLSSEHCFTSEHIEVNFWWPHFELYRAEEFKFLLIITLQRVNSLVNYLKWKFWFQVGLSVYAHCLCKAFILLLSLAAIHILHVRSSCHDEAVSRNNLVVSNSDDVSNFNILCLDQLFMHQSIFAKCQPGGW